MQITLENYIPPPCQRPRLGNGHAYSPSSKPEQGLAWMLISEINRNNIPDQLPITKPCKITISLFYAKNNKPRGDVDNIAKFVMDACQKAGIVKNDSLFDDLRVLRQLYSTTATVISIETI